jgi:hypothetical protein
MLGGFGGREKKNHCQGYTSLDSADRPTHLVYVAGVVVVRPGICGGAPTQPRDCVLVRLIPGLDLGRSELLDFYPPA